MAFARGLLFFCAYIFYVNMYKKSLTRDIFYVIMNLLNKREVEKCRNMFFGTIKVVQEKQA